MTTNNNNTPDEDDLDYIDFDDDYDDIEDDDDDNDDYSYSHSDNTIWEGDRLFGFRLAYKFSEPKRGDVIIFKYPDNESENYVKRVIGLPNEIVQIKEGHVYINGDELDEPYIKEYIYDDGETHTYIVPDGCYFMLGDNRNNSKDSRYWTNTYVKKEKIIAKVLIRYYSGEKGRISFSRIS